MSFGNSALRTFNRLLVPTTGLRLVADWRLRWQYAGVDDLEGQEAPRPSSIKRRVATRLNVGCGPDIRPGWLNVDARPLQSESESFLCCELLLIHHYIEEGCADEVLAQDILEHFSWRDMATLLARLAAILKSGGRLVVQSPDLDGIVEAYQRGSLSHAEAQRLIFGDQTYPQNLHRNIWSLDEARVRLTDAGLTVESVERVGYNVLARAVKS
jgi:predicted SAM-dependent methyltransferase